MAESEGIRSLACLPIPNNAPELRAEEEILLLLYGDKALHCQVEALTAASFMVIKRFIVSLKCLLLLLLW